MVCKLNKKTIDFLARDLNIKGRCNNESGNFKLLLKCLQQSTSTDSINQQKRKIHTVPENNWKRRVKLTLWCP